MKTLVAVLVCVAVVVAFHHRRGHKCHSFEFWNSEAKMCVLKCPPMGCV